MGVGVGAGAGAGTDWTADAIYIGSGLWNQWPVPFSKIGEWPTYEIWKHVEMNINDTLAATTTPQVTNRAVTNRTVQYSKTNRI